MKNILSYELNMISFPVGIEIHVISFSMTSPFIQYFYSINQRGARVIHLPSIYFFKSLCGEQQPFLLEECGTITSPGLVAGMQKHEAVDNLRFKVDGSHFALQILPTEW